jgi:prepilin-type N-terminal cleavage/methylation domain-containing protein
MQRASRSRRAFNLLELLVVIVLVLLLVVVVLFLGRTRVEHGPKINCAANLNGIGKGLYTYASENADFFPIAAHAPAMEEGVGRVAYAPHKIGLHRGSTSRPETGQTTGNETEMSTTRNLWTLVRAGGATPASLVCRASGDRPNDEENPQDFSDFRNYREGSYGYQVPYGKRAQPSSELDGRMIVAADKGPYGAVLEAGEPHPGMPAVASTALDKKAWRPWNSPNHQGEGQNVLFADSHIEYMNVPIVGLKRDNIYTRWSNPFGCTPDDEAACVQGTPPQSHETPYGETDSFIYP